MKNIEETLFRILGINNFSQFISSATGFYNPCDRL